MMLVAKRMLCTILIAVLTMGCYEPASEVDYSNQPQLENSKSVQLANPFPLRVNQIAVIESENLQLKLLEVKDDSRCPSGVQCIWPGLVEIVVSVTQDNHDSELILIDKEGDDDSASKNFDGYSIKLIEVTPYPQKNQTIEIEDYSATLVISRE